MANKWTPKRLRPARTLQQLNDVLRGHQRNSDVPPPQIVRVVKGSGYFYFVGGNSEDWNCSSVFVPNVHNLTLEAWCNEFDHLKNGGMTNYLLTHGD